MQGSINTAENVSQSGLVSSQSHPPTTAANTNTLTANNVNNQAQNESHHSQRQAASESVRFADADNDEKPVSLIIFVDILF